MPVRIVFHSETPTSSPASSPSWKRSHHSSSPEGKRPHHAEIRRRQETITIDKGTVDATVGVTLRSTIGQPTVVGEIIPGSIAEGVLRVGDIVVSVDGEKTTGATQATTLLRKGLLLELVISRVLTPEATDPL